MKVEFRPEQTAAQVKLASLYHTKVHKDRSTKNFVHSMPSNRTTTLPRDALFAKKAKQ